MAPEDKLEMLKLELKVSKLELTIEKLKGIVDKKFNIFTKFVNQQNNLQNRYQIEEKKIFETFSLELSVLNVEESQSQTQNEDANIEQVVHLILTEENEILMPTRDPIFIENNLEIESSSNNIENIGRRRKRKRRSRTGSNTPLPNTFTEDSVSTDYFLESNIEIKIEEIEEEVNYELINNFDDDDDDEEKDNCENEPDFEVEEDPLDLETHDEQFDQIVSKKSRNDKQNWIKVKRLKNAEEFHHSELYQNNSKEWYNNRSYTSYLGKTIYYYCKKGGDKCPAKRKITTLTDGSVEIYENDKEHVHRKRP